MPEENIVKVKVKGACPGEVFTLDKELGLVTFTTPIDTPLQEMWNSALQWLPVKSIVRDHHPTFESINFVILELITGETVHLTEALTAATSKHWSKYTALKEKT